MTNKDRALKCAKTRAILELMNKTVIREEVFDEPKICPFSGLAYSKVVYVMCDYCNDRGRLTTFACCDNGEREFKIYD